MDYSSQIRADIEREVKTLKAALENKNRYMTETTCVDPKAEIRADRVVLGYLVNTHHGLAIYKDGDKIDGTSIVIHPMDGFHNRVVCVQADNVRFLCVDEDVNENGGRVLAETSEYRDLSESINWQ